MGLAIKRAKPANTTLMGFDRDTTHESAALKIGAVDSLANSLEAAVIDANMVIVATPIISMRRVFEEIAPHLRQGTVVTDTASTKTDVLRWAKGALPQSIHFVGGHPMAGKEKA